MRRSLALGAAAATAVVASLATVAAMSVADDDPRPDRDGVMMSSGGHGATGHGGMHGGMSSGDMSGHGMHGDMQVTDEVGYLSEMVLHHEEAVAAAEELQRSERPEMRQLGKDIVASQTAQIALMEGWLDDWYPDRGEPPTYDPMMRDLADLSGDQLDRVFLEDMVGHHMAAVMMSQQLLMQELAEHDEVAELAETVRDEQHAEIFMMQGWLREWW